MSGNRYQNPPEPSSPTKSDISTSYATDTDLDESISYSPLKDGIQRDRSRSGDYVIHDPIDPTIDFLYKPHTATALFVTLTALYYVGFSGDSDDIVMNVKRGITSAVFFILLFGVLMFKDGPFIRPHPAIWRVVLACGLAYQCFLVFLFFQNVNTARQLFKYYDPKLGKALPERSYADNCELSLDNIKAQLDIFVLAHVFGWYAKAIILRDYWFCWILSIMFEVCEYSLQHHLPNFAECWWDHWIVDVLICNWLGTYLGMKTCEYFEMKQYSWRGIKQIRSYRDKMKRAVQQFTPHSWTKFEWGSTKNFKSYVSMLVLLFIFLLCELNAFYLKFILWIPPEHPLNVYRLTLYFFCGVPAVREFYQYLHDPNVTRFGTQAWMLVANIATETLICIKFGKGMFPAETPNHVIWFWTVFWVVVIVYPIWKFAVGGWQEKKKKKT